MRKRFHSRRGIFIISVLFIVVLVSMFVGAAFELAPWAFRRVANQAEVAAAHRAARSGLEYAVARLRLDPLWKAQTLKEIIEPGLYIREQDGNVVGTITDDGGLTSQFRLRFNYQDGSTGGDQMADPPSNMFVQIPLVSVNNIASNREMNVPKAEGSGSYSVPETPTVHTEIPPHSVYLVCEGRVGDFLRTVSPTNPNPATGSTAGLGTVSSARIETVYKLHWDFNQGTPAVAAAAGRFAAQVPSSLAMTDMTGAAKGQLQLDSADNSMMGRLRTRKDISVLGGTTGEKNLTAATGKQGEFRHGQTIGTAQVQASSNVGERAEVVSDPMFKITWDDVRKADGTNKIKAGTYTVWQDGSLHYYDMNLKDYKAFIKANPSNAGTTATLPASITYTPATKTFSITKDTLVDTTGTASTDLVIIPKRGADGGPDASGGAATAPSASEMKSILKTASAEVTLPVVGSVYTYTGSMSDLIYRAVGNLTGQAVPPVTYDPGGSGGWSITGIVAGAPILVQQGSTRAQNDFSAMLARYMDANLSNPAVQTALSNIGYTAGGLFSEIDTEVDTAKPQDLAVNFQPGGSETAAVLTAPGNVTLGARVVGEGGSITAEGDINLIGLGVTMSASTNPNEGVSLYSKENVLISTYDKAANKYHDVGLKGVVYCWGHFKAVLGDDAITVARNWGQFNLNGSLIAYGKDPTDPLAEYRGDVKIQAERAGLKFDSSYLLNVMNVAAWRFSDVRFGRVWWMQQ